MKRLLTMRHLSLSRAPLLLAAVILALAIGPLPDRAKAHSYNLPGIMVGHVWAPPPADGEDGIAVYGPILNTGAEALQLVGASSPIAEQTRFRISKDGAVSWPDSIELRPNKPFGMAKWREHIWLSGLKKTVKEGDQFEVVLDFGSAGKLPVEVVVEKSANH